MSWKLAVCLRFHRRTNILTKPLKAGKSVEKKKIQHNTPRSLLASFKLYVKVNQVSKVKFEEISKCRSIDFYVSFKIKRLY